uniref:NADH-ubiquinone oxidoreductase chain 1 n=1 Tax=Glossina morsitans morsitans TaxID=37546 RepID=A0A1B0GBZ2_GLOMM
EKCNKFRIYICDLSQIVLHLFEIILFIIRRLLLIIFVLVRVAFLTLLEREVLGYIQIRKGHNNVGIFGIPQPFRDAIKLFTKEQTCPLISNYICYYFSPIFWPSIPIFVKLFSFTLGGLRAVAETISYEVSLALIILSFIF